MPRTIADQTEDELGGPGSVLVRQREDHEELDHLLQELDRTTGHAQEDVLTRIDRLVFSHAFAEETVLWPVIRRVLPDGDALTRRIETEHQEVNELVAALEEGGPDSPERPARLARLVEVLQEDVRDEEDLLLPRLQERLDPAELRRLGRRWELVRRVAPTRPHPTVSRRPPGNVLSGLPLSLLDRSRDLVDTVVRRVPAAASAGRTVSRGLAAVAAVVERTPPARRGDGPPTAR
ncbi:Hemerythrin HHE cation binding domain-containing protein [Geodermatophilus dictyosporus]|uniref:Hemerythrin HHE cation binding domain-containing protein n=1 Tax=Geodermatophilus dictyosporus TaxID=1523247 RepID=A0A1I5LYK6_9ACTN|nr:hemerythrin domain-containing protein [Geodermatophilus dictyosporus]SFP01836.1 Hemerythrin HHE cation binding domain-containing protein [Geodermatophilus dictyosporus]